MSEKMLEKKKCFLMKNAHLVKVCFWGSHQGLARRDPPSSLNDNEHKVHEKDVVQKCSRIDTPCDSNCCNSEYVRRYGLVRNFHHNKNKAFDLK